MHCDQRAGQGKANPQTPRSALRGSGELREHLEHPIEILPVDPDATVSDFHHGLGTVIPDPCTECSGEGRVRSRRTLSVDVPAGEMGEILLGGGSAEAAG